MKDLLQGLATMFINYIASVFLAILTPVIIILSALILPFYHGRWDKNPTQWILYMWGNIWRI